MTRLPRKRYDFKPKPDEQRKALKLALDLLAAKATGSDQTWGKRSAKPVGDLFRDLPRGREQETVMLRTVVLIDALAFVAWQLSEHLELRGLARDEASLRIWAAYEQIRAQGEAE